MPKLASAVFFVYVWPEPLSSAAGVRTRALMRALQTAGYGVAAVSPSGESRYRSELESLGIATLTCDPNISPPTDSALSALSPDLVVYDRFVMEEQFGWRARALWPNAFHLVDTQDLHSLRRAREKLAAAGAPIEKILAAASLAEFGDDLLRELASLYRADGALVVSSFELDFLTGKLGFPAERLLHLPFPAESDETLAPFSERSGFCFLGNFRHPPNLDSVRWLLKEYWPVLRGCLPKAELHLYGAYPPAEVSRHKGTNGIFAHGPVEDHRAALRRHRALLAPLRFGAGIKGKVLEAWGTGTPAVGTALTFEGMGGTGITADSAETFAAAACGVHEEESRWREEQAKGIVLVRQNFEAKKLAENFLSFVSNGARSLSSQKEQNLVGQILRHQQNNATKYFSRWIEAKSLGK